MPDWNKNKKKDIFDLFIDMKIMSDMSENSDIDDEYSWREKYAFGYENDTDPDDYETEEEYLEALEKEKYSWREDYDYDNEVDPEDYETEEEYLEALEQNDLENDENENVSTVFSAQEPDIKKVINNSCVYNYCKVMIDSLNKQYDYLCGELEINVNDYVLVPLGKDNNNVKGTVVAVGKCLECVLATNINNMKTVLKILDKAEITTLKPVKKEENNIVYEDNYIKISLVKWEHRDYLVGGKARTGTFIFENKNDKRFCIYFKNISVGGFLNQGESRSIALSGKQKCMEDIIFVYENKIPEYLKNYNTIELNVCYGTIKEGLNARSLINNPIVESEVLSIKV